MVFSAFKMLSRVLRYGLYGSVISGGALLSLDAYTNEGLNSNGILRFGRTTLAVDKLLFHLYYRFETC